MVEYKYDRSARVWRATLDGTEIANAYTKDEVQWRVDHRDYDFNDWPDFVVPVKQPE